MAVELTPDARTDHAVGVPTLPQVPALVEGTVGHTRRSPLRHSFRYGVYQWLVDVDDLPRLRRPMRWFASFSAADHLGDPGRTLRQNVEDFCALHDVDVTGCRILMLANARILGHVFDPLTVFWCLAPDGRLVRLLAEVHNTYGERHVYLLDPDETGRDSTDKAFYVSPFFEVDGRYDLRFVLDERTVSSTIVLRQGGEAVFSATFRGRPRPLRTRRLLRLLVRQPLMTHRVSALIRIHGVWLWLRRLPVVARRPHDHQEGVR